VANEKKPVRTKAQAEAALNRRYGSTPTPGEFRGQKTLKQAINAMYDVATESSLTNNYRPKVLERAVISYTTKRWNANKKNS